MDLLHPVALSNSSNPLLLNFNLGYVPKNIELDLP